MLYTPLDPAHSPPTGPLIGPALAGADLGVIARATGAELPQAFVAVTLMLPEAVPTVVGMLAVADVPLQPAPGSVHA